VWTRCAQASLKSAALDIQDIVQFHQMDAEHLSFGSGLFDTVADTFSLCVFSDPVAGTERLSSAVIHIYITVALLSMRTMSNSAML
jgi:hypothetical protein